MMDVILEAKEQIEPEFKTFTENRVKFSLKKLFWLVRKIKVKYSVVAQAKNSCNQNCIIELQTFDNRQIEVSITARDRRTALEMGLKKACKLMQKAFHKAQKYGRLSRQVYV
ncbi:hypothetical protein AOC21_07215 [Polynucleobacter sp. VK25]|uniref:hypothetical protein n=1 Tax=Polynucleobacter sp. VK25 TaxID=1758398 RepID=UPI001BFD7BA4|nr:hypothetical protein [Polynucleobacter sp. VK25]QWD67825.1 hypothetical protein AOC21_07215 [Polynucleobacter sp. VK25]